MSALAPNYVAGGNISPSRFVFISGADFTVLQATGGTVKIVGIAQDGTRDAPGLSGASAFAAIDDDTLRVFGLGEVCQLEAGAPIVRGDFLSSNADGKGVPAGLNDVVGAFALESASSGEFVRVVVLIAATAGASGTLVFTNTVTSLTDTVTVTIAQLLTGIIQGTPTAAATYTMPTAALAVAAFPNAKVGDTILFNIHNQSGGANTITVAAGAGGTLKGAATVAQNVGRIYKLTLTNVTAASEAYTLYSMSA